MEAPEGTVVVMADGTRRIKQNGQWQETSFQPPSGAPTPEQRRAAVYREKGIPGFMEAPVEAGAGFVNRGREIASLGMVPRDREVARSLEGSTPATVGGIGADVAGMYAMRRGTTARGWSPPTTPAGLGAEAGLYGAATTPGDASDRLLGMGIGGVAGLVGGAVPHYASKLLKPAVDKSAEKIARAGITTTPGQLSTGGPFKTIEGWLSKGIFGDVFMRPIREEQMDQFNTTMINRALRLIDRNLPRNVPAGRDAITYANDALDDQYSKVLGNMNLNTDRALQAELDNVFGIMRNAKMPEEYQDLVLSEFRAAFGETLEKGTVALGETLHEGLRTLRKAYEPLLGKGGYQGKAGDAIREIHRSIERAAVRQNPMWAGEYKKTQAAYAALSAINEASTRAGAKSGIFTPHHLKASIVKRSQQATGAKRQAAKGDAPDQEFIEAADEIIGASTGSGSLLGSLQANLLPMALIGGGALTPGEVGYGMMAAGSAYTPMGRKALANWALRPGGQKTADVLRGLADQGARIGTGSALNMFNGN